MIKLVASDIDGTLLRDGNTEISKEVFEHIRRLKESGVLFAAASGMTFMTMLFIGPLSAVIAGIFAILDYAILIVGSCYVISYVLLKARTHGMKAGECALHVILQLFFVTDVLDSMYLTAVRAKRYRVLTSCICLLLAAGLICVGVYMSYSV